MKLQHIIEAKTPNLSHLITKDVKKLGDIFKKNNESLRIVGGAVRDALLGKTPKDIDLATTATPEKMVEIAKNENIKVIETGLQHGTVTFVINGEPYEITTLRTDVNTDGRHAEVEWTDSFKEDAERRDLTYNAMSVDMEGNLHDYFNGLKDLRNNTTKFVGDTEKRIQEDFLRILRYFRFLSKQPNQQPNKDTLETIKNNIRGLENISGERIWMEISKMATYVNFPNTVKAMCSVGVDNILFFDSCNESTFKAVSRLQQETNNPITILSPLFSDVLHFTRFANKLKLPNEYKNLGYFINSEKNKPKESYSVEILNDKLSPEYVLELSKVINSTNLKANTKKTMTAGTFPVTGNDLISAGVQPGPKMGKTLSILKKEWIDSDYKLTKQQLLDKIINKSEGNNDETTRN